MISSSPYSNDTIVALASPHGTGAIALIRLSGKDVFSICNTIFLNKDKNKVDLSKQKTHTIHFGLICDKDFVIDEVLLSVFKSPHSYTGENAIEISCHGSLYIQQQILQLIVRAGARMANPGEFTLRAFLNGKFDLSQAEAIADVIASNSATSHQVAMMQMRGGFSGKIKTLRDNLIDFASLIELELDFSEEDVEFADRNDLKKLIISIQNILRKLIESFELGNVIKNGIPVAIIGKPNAGKSTLLNALLNDDKAIVSEIPGTTRDAIEDILSIDGVLFRFIDTAGIRETTDVVESIGVNKTFEKIKQSAIVIYLFDARELTIKELDEELETVRKSLGNAELIVVANKIDKEDLQYLKEEFSAYNDIIYISAKNQTNIDVLKSRLVELFDRKAVNVTETVVSNARHVSLLRKTNASLERVLDGLQKNITGDMLAQDVRNALHHLGEISGEISSDDLLKNIFSRFCIGK